MGAIDDFLAASVTHERLAAAVHPALTAVARWSLAALAVEILLVRSLGPTGVLAATLVVAEATAAAGATTAALTRGYRRANAAGQAVLLALGAAALVLPAVALITAIA